MNVGGAFNSACLRRFGGYAGLGDLCRAERGVAISHGEGFRQITGNTDVAVGDSVIASPGGSSKIVFDDGCTEEVKPGEIATVQAASPCNPGAYVAPSHAARPYIIGAAVVGGVVTAAVLLGQNGTSGHKNKNKNANSASP